MNNNWIALWSAYCSRSYVTRSHEQLQPVRINQSGASILLVVHTGEFDAECHRVFSAYRLRNRAIRKAYFSHVRTSDPVAFDYLHERGLI